jgi:hypothetical protein
VVSNAQCLLQGSDMEGEDEDEEEDDDFSDPLESGVDAAFQQLAAADAAADDLYVQLEEMLPSAGHPVMFGGDGGMRPFHHQTVPIFNDYMPDSYFIRKYAPCCILLLIKMKQLSQHNNPIKVKRDLKS